MKIIQIDITNACPRKCANCTRFCGHHEEPFFMDFETFKKAVDSLKGFRGIVGIMGGEPTVHPEFRRFVEYYRDNIGYDDRSTAPYQPQKDLMRHVLANAWHVDYSNHRGLFTSVTPRYYDHFELIQDTFGYQLLNDHSNPSMHQTLMVTRQELGVPDDEWVKMRDRCWVQNLWSASITPKGAFFCEVAAAMDATLGGPGGWPIEPGWWQRKPDEFGEQLKWCEMCSACLAMPSRDANDETDDVSPIWAEKLKQIRSPKVDKGLVNQFDPLAYQADKHSINQRVTPYMEDQEERMGKTRGRLVPQKITYVLWLTPTLGDEAATRLITQMKAAGQLDAIASTDATRATLAEVAALPFLTGLGALADLRQVKHTKDWVVLTRDCAAPAAFHALTEGCVFNPGVVYWRDIAGGMLRFFNVRARSLEKDGDLFNITATFPAYKVVELTREQAQDYRLSNTGMFMRRLNKRFTWLKRKLAGLPVPRGPAGEIKGNKVVSSL
ncbi:radical SAM protein [Acidocella sp.]|nr:radical SAM protein [Acidocella sp.]